MICQFYTMIIILIVIDIHIYGAYIHRCKYIRLAIDLDILVLFKHIQKKKSKKKY